MHATPFAAALAITALAVSGAGAAAVSPRQAGAGTTASQPLVVTTIELTPILDNTLYQSTTGSLSNGQGTSMFAGRTGTGSTRRALVRFDVAAAIPAGSVVSSATLRLNMSRTVVGPVTVRIHHVSADWGEGGSNDSGQEGSGAPAALGDATWIHRFFNTEFWTTPGGDFAAAPSAAITVNSLGVYTWGSNAQMVADVQAWLDDPASNFGWIVIGDEGTFPTAKRFDTSENSTAVRPRLIIEYTETPQLGRCCTRIGDPGATCLDGLTEAECDAQPDPTRFTVGASCTGDLCADCPTCTSNAECFDGNACTDDTCGAAPNCTCVFTPNFDGGVECCNPQTGAVTPLQDNNPCTGTGACNSGTGQVTYPPAPAGTPCSDGNTCTTNDRCNASALCVADPLVCNDNNACTRNDRCVPGSGCVADPITGQACTADAECSPGACVSGRCQCPAAPGAIPTLSEWGLCVLSLLLLVGARLCFRPRGGCVAATVPAAGR